MSVLCAILIPSTTQLAEPSYVSEKLSGWTLQVDRSLGETNQALLRDVKAELRRQLEAIVRVVPDGPLAKLRQVTIWIHPTSPETKCMAYHPGAQWLRDHRMNPQMEKGIEIGNARAFLSWTYEQPWMVLHELAHAHHDRFASGGFENADISSVFKLNMEAKRYESVLHWDGQLARHYACTNPMEYFAETTEAYFGANDFYPFVKAELQRHDPEGLALMKRIWGVTKKREPES